MIPLDTKRTAAAQSAMEYLMTYGWAILVILVVLGILYLLHVFSPGSIFGTSCNAAFNYLCENPSLASNGTVSFVGGQSTEVPEYNVAFACTSVTNTTSGGPFSSTNPWNYLGKNLTLSKSYNSSNSYALQSSYKVQVNNLPCYGSDGSLLAPGTLLSSGTSFSGTLWIRFTSGAGVENSNTNKWITAQLASVTLQVSVQSTNVYGNKTTGSGTTTVVGTTTASGSSSIPASTTSTGSTTTPGGALLPFSSPLIILIAGVIIVVIIIVLYLRSRMS